MEAWGLPGTSFGGSGGHVGARPFCIGPALLHRAKKGIVIPAFLGPHFGTCWALFRNLKDFWERFFWVSVWIGFGTDFGVVFGVNLRCFWSVFFGFSLTDRASEKSGFDMVTVFAAHSHVRKLMKKCEKMSSKFEVRSGTLRGTLLGSILERSGVTLGSLGASI